MDAFFAAVEERDNPAIAGLPIVVGADPDGGYGRGVVSTANYKAREYGIHSALPISRAWRLSEEAKKQGKPAAIFLRGSFEKYEKVSERIMDIIQQILKQARPPKFPEGNFERASVDEAYFDLTVHDLENRDSKEITPRTPLTLRGEKEKESGSRGGVMDWVSAEKTASAIKKEIFEKEKLTSSIGIGPNKLIAKIASDFKKPDGLTIVREEDAGKFLEPMGVRKIPGIGPKTQELLATRKVFLISDIKNLSGEELAELVGKKWGEALYDKARGIDDSPLVTEREAKTIGEQETFQKDTLEINFLMESLERLCKNIFERFENESFSARGAGSSQALGWKSFRTIAVTVRFADFETKTRAHTIKSPASDQKILGQEALKLFMPFLDSRENPHYKSVRLLGVRIEKLKQNF